MEIRYNRRSMMDGIQRLLAKSDYKLVQIIWMLLKYIHGEDED